MANQSGSTDVEINTSAANSGDATVQVTTTHTAKTQSSSTSTSTSSGNTSVNQTSGGDPWDDDDEPTIENSTQPSKSSSSKWSSYTGNPLLKRLTILIAIIAVVYVCILILVRFIYPTPRQAALSSVDTPGTTASGHKLGPDGSIGGSCGTHVHRMKWVPRYGWLVDVNKELCKPRVGLCTDDVTGEIPNKWCSYSCRLNLNSPAQQAPPSA